jgi:DNA-binding transcriptional MerR regulator
VSDEGRAPEPLGARPAAPFPDDAAPLYTIGQVAGMLGVQIPFLRRLESERLVTPARSDGGQRRYSRNEIDDIHAIVGLVGEGFTLAGARRIIALQAEVAELRRQLAELS